MTQMLCRKLSAVRAQRFVEIARVMLCADGAALSDGRDVVASAGIPAWAFAEPEVRRTGLRADVRLDHDVVRNTSRCTVFSQGAAPLALTVEWPRLHALEPRIQVILGALARSAPVAVGVHDSAASVEERLTVSGGQILAELALCAESVDELLGGITAALGLLVGGTAAGVAILNDRGFLQLLPGSFGAPPELIASALADRTELAMYAMEVFRSGQAMIANNSKDDIPKVPTSVAKFGIERLMAIPMNLGDDKHGVVCVANRSEPFSRRDAELADWLAPHIAAAVAQVRQRFEMTQREAQVLAIGRVAEAIATGLGAMDLKPCLENFRQALNCRALVLTLREDSRQIAVGDLSAVEPKTGFLAGVDAHSSAVHTASCRPVVPEESGWASVQFPVLVDGEVRATLAALRTPWLPFEMHERHAISRMCETIALAWTAENYLRQRAEIERRAERARIADDIHDGVAQLLVAGRMSLQHLQEDLTIDPPAAHPALRHAQHALEMIARSECELREVINQSAEIDQLPDSLAQRLRNVVAEVEHQFGVEILLDLPNGDSVPSLGAQRNAAVLASAREAMVNAAKHAGSCSITVVLEARAADVVTLRVVDDGVGDLGCGAVGYGVNAMRRRLAKHSASLVIRPGPRGGTEVIIEASGAHSYLRNYVDPEGREQGGLLESGTAKGMAKCRQKVVIDVPHRGAVSHPGRDD